MFIAAIVRKLTGRSYRIEADDISYLVQKGAMPFLRGALWSLARLRRPNGLLLGARVQFVSAGRLRAGRGVSIGAGSYVDCSARNGIVLNAKVTLRERAWIQGRSGLNERAEGLWIGELSYIGPNAVLGIGGPIRIGRRVQAGAGLTLSAESHEADADGSFTSGHVRRLGITIGDDCWIGNNVCVLDGVDIGAGSVIGAGAVVTRTVPPGSVAVGAPARVIRSVDAPRAHGLPN